MDKKFLEEHGEEIFMQMMEKLKALDELFELELIESRVAATVIEDITKWACKVGVLSGCYDDDACAENQKEFYSRELRLIGQTKLKAV